MGYALARWWRPLIGDIAEASGDAAWTGWAGLIQAVGLLAGKFLFIDQLLSGIVSNGVVPPIEVADVIWVSPILVMIGAAIAAVTGYVTLRLYVRL